MIRADSERPLSAFACDDFCAGNEPFAFAAQDPDKLSGCTPFFTMQRIYLSV